MITQEELKEILHYEPSTGDLTCLTARKNVKVGGKAGFIDKKTGYWKVMVNRKSYQGHRLIWLYMEGYLPEYQIDHMNGIRDDNRWENLRHVTQTCNLQNLKVRTDNKSGFPGVSYNKRDSLWVAFIGINNRCINLGSYNSPLEAALARYTVEVQCPKWTCNHRSKLVQAIHEEWADFKLHTEED